MGGRGSSVLSGSKRKSSVKKLSSKEKLQQRAKSKRVNKLKKRLENNQVWRRQGARVGNDGKRLTVGTKNMTHKQSHDMRLAKFMRTTNRGSNYVTPGKIKSKYRNASR